MAIVGKFNPALEPLLVPIAELSEDLGNARRHDERNLAAIGASLEAFGQQKPIVVKAKVVKAGNGTFRKAKELGWTHIAAIEFDLDGRKAREYAIADNRSGELAGWELPVLADQIVELSSEAEAWEPTALGFTWAEIDTLFDGNGDSRNAFAVAQAEQAAELARAAADAARAAAGDVVPKTDEERDRELSAIRALPFAIIIECTGEEQQRALIEECLGRGLRCRALI